MSIINLVKSCRSILLLDIFFVNLLFTTNGQYTEGTQHNTKTKLSRLFYLIMHTNINRKDEIINYTTKQVSTLRPFKKKIIKNI